MSRAGENTPHDISLAEEGPGIGSLLKDNRLVLTV